MIRLTDRQLQIVMTAAASLKDCRQRGCDAHQPMLLCDYEAPAAHAPDRECGRRAYEATPAQAIKAKSSTKIAILP